ncbi:Type II secretion system (T2SS), protein L/GspL periplasmic domain [Puniceibacterium sp. IMCC21224]|nr:Type II secretion system (T2SS), protein L/GspL periplasmic domain [Puniceibacterium sp. IMCC21224]
MARQKTLQDTALFSLTGGTDAPRGRYVALVPGAEVPLLALDLPRGLRGPAREEVARRQLRDRIGPQGDRVEMRPFVLTGDGDGWSRALVADAGLLAGWRTRTGAACRAVLPDYLALPTGPSLWTLQIEAGSVQARLGPGDGFSADPDLARVMVSRALDAAAATPPKAVLVLKADREVTELPWLAPLLATQDIALLTSLDAVEAAGLARPQVLAHGELRLDLRTDPRAARARLRARVLPWRWPLLIGLLAAGLWGTAQILAIQALTQAQMAERGRAMALVRDHFIPVGPVLDIRVQVARALAEREAAAQNWRGRTSPLLLFGQAAEVIAAQGAQPQELRYDRSEGLRVVLDVADFAAAEQVAGALREVGLQTDVVESRVSDTGPGVRTELRLREAP